MKIIDISRRLDSRLATYPVNPPYLREVIRDVPEFPSSLSRISLGTHTGTHVDAPRHVIKNGKGVESTPLEALIAPAVVIDCRAVADTVTAADLRRACIPVGHVVLLKTKNSAADPTVFDERFVACDESAAAMLAALPVPAVGIDGPSIKKFRARDRTHHLFLERGIPIVEGLDLSRAPAGAYTFICLPLALDGSDGAPARAVLYGGS